MYDIALLGNAPVDALTNVDDSLIDQFNLRRGDFHVMPHSEFIELDQAVNIEKLESGGSAANTAWTLSQLGRKVAFIGRVGADPAGRHFYKDMLDAGVTMPDPVDGARTMEIYVLVTPQGDRTFVSHGVSAPMSAAYVPEDMIANSRWLLIEGYTMMDQMDAVDQAIWLARKHGVKIAMTLAATVVLEQCYDNIASEILKGVDLLIANDEEMSALIRAVEEHSHTDAEQLAAKITAAPRVITYGPNGADFVAGDRKVHLPCTPVAEPMDTTGAGDAFAAGFLYAWLEAEAAGQVNPLPDDAAIEKGLGLGHLLAHSVINQLGARLKRVDDTHKQAAVA